MKRLLVFAVAAFLAVSVFSQDVVIVGKDSLSQDVTIDDVRKIAFKDGNLITTYSNGSTTSQKLSGNDKLQFAVQKQEDSIADEAETYTIYDLSGRPVKTHTDRSCDQPFDLNDLASGIYLLKMGNRTIKIVK